MYRIAILITCHNRKEKTIACLKALFASDMPVGHLREVFLVDDGSTDGTSDAVREYFPAVNISVGSGNLYWCRGMHAAFAAAMEKDFDYYLWLNDDTLLYGAAIVELVASAQGLKAKYGTHAIVAGTTREEASGQPTYGGVNRPVWWKLTSFKLVAPTDIEVECETMNGNCVLIPREVVRSVGNMEPGFAHAMGDLDYGLRARRKGFSVWVVPGFVGTCSNNAAIGSFNDATLPLSVRMRKLMHPKGLPLSSWRLFTQRHAGILWPAFWLLPYAKVMVKGLVRR